MDPVTAITAGFHKAFDFESRISRSEFWWFIVFLVMVNVVLQGMMRMMSVPVFFQYVLTAPIYFLSISATTRRLHDINRSGWWQLLGLTGIGYLLVMIACMFQGNAFDNDYGDEPQPA